MNIKQQIRRSIKVLRRSEDTIPLELISSAEGIVFFTQVKGGFFWSGTLGSGIFLKKLGPGKWSPPVSLGMASAGIGFQFGLQKADIVIILNDRSSVRAFEGHGQISFGGDYNITAGPVGRTLKADLQLSSGGFSGAFSYSMSKGLMIGVSLEGACLIARTHDNHSFYKTSQASTRAILNGKIPVPEDKQEGIKLLHKALNAMVTGRSHLRDFDPFIYNEIESDDEASSSDAQPYRPYQVPTNKEKDPVELSQTGKELLNLGLDGVGNTEKQHVVTSSTANQTTEELDLIDWGAAIEAPVAANPNPDTTNVPIINVDPPDAFLNLQNSAVTYGASDPFEHLDAYAPATANPYNHANAFDNMNWLDPTPYVDAGTHPSGTTSTAKIPVTMNIAITDDHIVDENDSSIKSHGIISCYKGEKGTLLDGDLQNGLGGAYVDYCMIMLDSGKTGKVSRHVLVQI